MVPDIDDDEDADDDKRQRDETGHDAADDVPRHYVTPCLGVHVITCRMLLMLTLTISLSPHTHHCFIDEFTCLHLYFVDQTV